MAVVTDIHDLDKYCAFASTLSSEKLLYPVRDHVSLCVWGKGHICYFEIFCLILAKRRLLPLAKRKAIEVFIWLKALHTHTHTRIHNFQLD